MASSSLINSPSLREFRAHYQALASITRLRILQFLAGIPEITVLELADAIGISQPRLSWHLRMLRRGQLVRTRRLLLTQPGRPACLPSRTGDPDRAPTSGSGAATRMERGVRSDGNRQERRTAQRPSAKEHERSERFSVAPQGAGRDPGRGQLCLLAGPGRRILPRCETRRLDPGPDAR